MQRPWTRSRSRRDPPRIAEGCGRWSDLRRRRSGFLLRKPAHGPISADDVAQCTAPCQAALPKNWASPNVNTPPSAPTSQYPPPSGVLVMPMIGAAGATRMPGSEP